VFDKPLKRRKGVNLDYCLEQIQDMELQLAQMQQLAGESPLQQQQQLETMAATFQKLRNAWEELHQQNEQLRQVNDRFQLAASAVNCLIYDWDVENRTVDRTQGIFELLGYRTEEAEPTLDWWLQRIHPDDRQRIRKEISDALACHSSFTTEYRMRRQDNQYLYIWERGLIIRNATGQAVRVVGSNYNITPRKQAEESIKRSAAEISQIFNMLPSFVWKFCPASSKFIYASEIMTEISGISREAFFQNHQIWHERVESGHESQEAIRRAWEAITQGEPYTVVYLFHTLHRGARWFEITARPAYEEGVLYYYGSTTDITERKQAKVALERLNEELENRVRERTAQLEQKNQQLKVEIAQRARAEASLRQREQEFRALAENAPDIIARFDRELRHLYVNPASEQAYGRPPQELIGKTHRELGMPEANVSLWEQVIRKIFETGQKDVIEFSFLTPNGLKHYQTYFVPELAADGSTASVLGICRDVTEHKQALEALRESEQWFRQLAENIHEVFWISSVDDSQVIYVSPAYEELWGRTRESLYDQRLSWLDVVHPEDRDRVFAAFEKQSQQEYDQEYRIVRPDGSIRWIRDRVFPVRDEQGRVYRFAGIAEDITSRKLAEVETYNALQRERERGELKSRWVAMTSHEFRTPLTAVQSSAEMVERYRQRFSEEQQQTHLHRIKIAVKRMTQMLEEILLLSEAEAGKLVFNPAPLDLVALCRDLVEELQVADNNQQAITFTHLGDCTFAAQASDQGESRELDQTPIPNPQSLPLLDEKLLRHILSNLLSNAIKYSPGGRTVQFNLTCLDDKVVFQIQDQGIGIPPEDQPRLFEAFHRATNVGPIQATGLGLTLVKQCVDLHRGEITFTSVVGEGTTFSVTLPLSNETPL
jgi:PAS domain S-box-containing protein